MKVFEVIKHWIGLPLPRLELKPTDLKWFRPSSSHFIEGHKVTFYSIGGLHYWISKVGDKYFGNSVPANYGDCLWTDAAKTLSPLSPHCPKLLRFRRQK